jgi:hypothetical protein
MTYTLAQLTYRVARELGITVEGIATGGTTGTLLDANDRTEADNYWLDGTLWVLRDAGGAGAAPENEVRTLSASTSSTGTLTVRTAFTVSPAAGDRYALAYKFGGNPWLYTLQQKINQAIQDLGRVPQTDITTIVGADNQTEYTLPAAAGLDLRQVWYQGDNTDSNDNRWRELIRGSHWYVQENSTAGTADTLVLAFQPSSAYYLKLVYMAPHPMLLTDTSYLSDHVPVERVVIPATLECFRYMKQVTGWNKWDSDIQRYDEMATRIRSQYSIHAPRRAPGLIVAGGFSDTYVAPGTVRLSE